MFPYLITKVMYCIHAQCSPVNYPHRYNTYPHTSYILLDSKILHYMSAVCNCNNINHTTFNAYVCLPSSLPLPHPVYTPTNIRRGKLKLQRRKCRERKTPSCGILTPWWLPHLVSCATMTALLGVSVFVGARLCVFCIYFSVYFTVWFCIWRMCMHCLGAYCIYLHLHMCMGFCAYAFSCVWIHLEQHNNGSVCLHWQSHAVYPGDAALFSWGHCDFFTRGSQTGSVPNNTHSHLHNPSIPKGRRGRETERQAQGETARERGVDEKRRIERRRKSKKDDGERGREEMD